MGRVRPLSGYLLDTHILLWAWHQPERIPAWMVPILGSDSRLRVSMATFWEIAVKVSNDKLTTVSDPFARAIETNVELLEIRPEHIEAVRRLPHHHRDPFDRMLIAQAQVEKLTILTADRNFAAYDVAIA